MKCFDEAITSGRIKGFSFAFIYLPYYSHILPHKVGPYLQIIFTFTHCCRLTLNPPLLGKSQAFRDQVTNGAFQFWHCLTAAVIKTETGIHVRDKMDC